MYGTLEVSVKILIPFNPDAQQFSYKNEALYHALRDSMMEGKLTYGTKLPSSREAASTYGVSRGLVTQVYEMLISEGFVEAVPGKGTFVAYRSGPSKIPSISNSKVDLSVWGSKLGEAIREPGKAHAGDAGAPVGASLQEMGAAPAERIEFELAGADAAVFPRQAWNRCLHEQVRSSDYTSRPLQDPLGDPALRAAVSLHLRRSRSIDADPDRIAIVNGSMQAIALTMQLLVNPGDPVIVESPGYGGARRAAAAAGGVPVDAVIDEQGIVPQPWEARLLFVTPGRQFPTGVQLPLARRQELLRWAGRRGGIIIEDDYDTEFRYAGRPIEPLKALDREDRVVFIGTFSRTMYDGLRLGYVVLPHWLAEPFRVAKKLYEPHPAALLEQRALAVFMNSGSYERHLRRMQRIYGAKAAQLRLELEPLSAAFEWLPNEAGIHIFGWWKGAPSDYAAFMAECGRRGVIWRDAASYIGNGNGAAACLGFSHLSAAEISRGTALMAEVLRTF
nr:PLP-dependent aminotransferase family protein [Paenibacillus lutrae]